MVPAVMSSSALSLIGNTPLVALDRLHPGPGRIFAKAEFLNPGGSIKDRPAQLIVERARAEGRLKPGQPIVTMTSGNFGSGLAIVGAVLGHPVVTVMSAGNTLERRAMLAALGAEVALTPQVDGRPGEVTGADIAAAEVRAKQLAYERKGFLIDQFSNPASVDAHFLGTGPELLTQSGRRVRSGSLSRVARCAYRCRAGVVLCTVTVISKGGQDARAPGQGVMCHRIRWWDGPKTHCRVVVLVQGCLA